jgi:hypothetical protein
VLEDSSTDLSSAKVVQVLLQVAVLVDPAGVREGVVLGMSVLLVPAPRKRLLETAGLAPSDSQAYPAALLSSSFLLRVS